MPVDKSATPHSRLGRWWDFSTLIFWMEVFMEKKHRKTWENFGKSNPIQPYPWKNDQSPIWKCTCCDRLWPWMESQVHPKNQNHTINSCSRVTFTYNIYRSFTRHNYPNKKWHLPSLTRPSPELHVFIYHQLGIKTWSLPTFTIIFCLPSFTII